MKATLKELFSEFEDDIIDIPEDTIYSDMGISKAAVRKRALAQTDHRQGRKHSGRVIRLTFIAAAVMAVFVLSSTIIYANGGLQAAFEEFFGGNMSPSGLYDGGNVEIKTSDPNLDISFLGVTGDEHEMYAVIKAVKKDGGTFADENRIEYIDSDADIDPEDVPVRLDSHGIYAVCKDRWGNNFGSGSDGYTPIDRKYYLSEDRKTIKLLIHLDTDYSDTMGGTKNLDPRYGTAMIESVSYVASNPVRIIMTDDQMNAKTHERFLKKCEELNIDEFSCTWIYTADKVIFCQAEEKKYDLPFEITFRMNYRDDGNIKRELTFSDAPHFIKPDTRNVQMTVTPFSVRITGKSDYVDDVNCFRTVDVHNSRVIMEDGAVYYFESRGGGGTGGPAVGKAEESCLFLYEEKPDITYETEKILIDTRQIKEIIINGDKVYSAEK